MSWKTVAPVPAAIRAAARSPASRVVGPPSSSAAEPERSARDRGLDRLVGDQRRRGHRQRRRGPEGLIPAGVRGQHQRRDPAAPGRRDRLGRQRRRRPRVRAVASQCEAGRAIPSMSRVSGAPSGLCAIACSPTRLTIGVRALYALWTFANAFPKPGPRCSSVAAGRSGHPRVAVRGGAEATPSNSVSTPRTSGTRSIAATRCISDVPGLAKQTSTPDAASVRSTLSAPFTARASKSA